MSRTVVTYLGVWFALLVLLASTVTLAHFDLGWGNDAVALCIAGVKAGLVLWFFMELRRSDLATRSSAGGGILVLAALLVLTFLDYMTRNG